MKMNTVLLETLVVEVQECTLLIAIEIVLEDQVLGLILLAGIKVVLDDLVLVLVGHTQILQEVQRSLMMSPIAYHHWEGLILCLGIVPCIA